MARKTNEVKKRTRTKIKRHLPPIGTNLVCYRRTRPKTPYYATIVSDPTAPDGRAIKYNNVLYRSLTAAAKAVAGYSVNGWEAWHIIEK